MRVRLALTLDIHRDPKPTLEAPEERDGDPRPPMVDGKGSFIIERAHQDEPNEFRTGFHRTSD